MPPDVATQHADAVDRAITDLRYGSININVVTMLGFCVPKLTWGAYPGNTPQVRFQTAVSALLFMQSAMSGVSAVTYGEVNDEVKSCSQLLHALV